MKCEIEVFINKKWTKAAEFDVRSLTEVQKGYSGTGYLDYDPDFIDLYLGRTDIAAVSCRYTVNYELYNDSAWPAFLLDLLPSGASRRYWLQTLNLKDGPESDWPLLLAASGNPPGNIRIQEAAQRITESMTARNGPPHEGFQYSDILDRREHFIEYANQHGAPVAGSTGAQGDAPKFLLTEDRKGRWHADGALSDELTAKHWLVKFPRGKQESDRAILRNEAAYAKVAKEAGLHIAELPIFENDVLFVPRFDRFVVKDEVIRNGQESLCSLAGISEFGKRISQEKLCEVIAKYSSKPQDDVQEFILRDVLNVALGNTDNHARNTAVSKYPDGTVRLSPLFDFAPMFLDDQGIARVCRWADAEHSAIPDWSRAVRSLSNFGLDPNPILKTLSKFKTVAQNLRTLMIHCGVDQALIERLQPKLDGVADSLGRI